MRITERFGAALGAVVGMALWSTASAAVIIGNYPPDNDLASSTVAASTGDFSKAAGFTMPAGTDYTLDSITLRLEVIDVDATLTVELYGDAGGDPVGPSLLTFINPALPAGTDDFVFLPSGAFLLEAGLTYWIVASGASPTLDGILWWGSNPGITPTGIATSAGYRFDDTGVLPPTGPSGILNTFQVDGTAVAAVPVPATLWLFAVGLAGFGMVCRRRAA